MKPFYAMCLSYFAHVQVYPGSSSGRWEWRSCYGGMEKALLVEQFVFVVARARKQQFHSKLPELNDFEFPSQSSWHESTISINF